MRPISTTVPKVPRLALLIGLAVLLTMLALPATQGVAAPAAQGEPTQTPLVVVATAFLLANKAEQGIKNFREEHHEGFFHRSEP